MASWSKLAPGLLLPAMLLGGRALADPFIGDAGAAYSTSDGAVINPANAAFVDRTQIFFEPSLFSQSELDVRYPGFPPTDTTNNGVSAASMSDAPSFIWKPTPRLGLGGYALPPGIGANISKNGIPVILLGQQSYVDLKAAGTLEGAGQVIAGYRVSDRFGVGLNLTFQSIKLNATLTPQGSSDPLATIAGTQTQTTLTLGVRLDPLPGRLALGAAVILVSQSNQNLSVSSPLLGGVGSGSSGSSGSSGTNGSGRGSGGGLGGASSGSTLPLAGATVGMQVALGSKIRVLADGVYTHVDKTQTGFSLVQLKEETKDVHDTLAVRTGAILRLLDNGNVLVGYRYEPASLGEGSTGPNGQIGFGTQDLVMVETGMQDLTPYQQFGVGLQLGFSPKVIHPPKGSNEPVHGYYEWTIETGVVYKQASLGIDQNGELPGAYLYTQTSIPVGILYKF